MRNTNTLLSTLMEGGSVEPNKLFLFATGRPNIYTYFYTLFVFLIMLCMLDREHAEKNEIKYVKVFWNIKRPIQYNLNPAGEHGNISHVIPTQPKVIPTQGYLGGIYVLSYSMLWFHSDLGPQTDKGK